MLRTWRGAAAALGLIVGFALAGCGGESTAPGAGGAPTPDGAVQADAEGPLVVYSGRSESLVAGLIALYTEQTGNEVEVRYGKTFPLARTIQDEGDVSPCDVFFAQDAGGLGLLAADGLLAELPGDIVEVVPASFRSPDGRWVGVSGRARVLCYSTDRIKQDELPASVLELTDPKWKGRIGWPPSNASFQAFVTALRKRVGDDKAAEWLRAMKRNGVRDYPKNTPIVKAIIAGTIDLGLVNHYYLHRIAAETAGDCPATNYHFASADVGNLVNVAGAAIVASSTRPASAAEFVRFLVSEEAQAYFATNTYEYPLRTGMAPPAGILPLSAIEHPDVDLGALADLEATVQLMRECEVLE